jgi:toxin ParE1/3/4
LPRHSALPVLWHQDARQDLYDIVTFIAARNPDAAQRIKDRIIARARNLARSPLACRKGRVEGTREMVAHPNYLVVYAVAPDHVMILGIMHARRDWA